MIKILLVTEDNKQSERFNNIFNKNSYELSVMTDETLIFDIISAEAPDIIIIDENFRDIKNFNKKVKSICETTIIIFLVSSNKLDKELIRFANAFIT